MIFQCALITWNFVYCFTDETTRIEKFRTECISKAIKSNTVDIVSSYTRRENPVIFLLPLWLSENDITLLKRKTCLKYKCRTFLVLLREKRFDTIRRWIQEESRLEETVTNHIWKTFEEFNDTELILQRMCTFCKLKLKVDVSDIIDHLCSIEMISDALYTEINASDKTVGLQNELWLKVANQCKSFPIQGYVTEALRIALADCLESVENDTGKDVINEIVTELANVNGTACDIIECKCNAICSRELQPVSLIKSMSLVNVYKSPQTKRKSVSNGSEPKDAGIVRDKREIETSNSSSTSSNESIESNLKMKTLQFVDNETMESESLDDRFISLQKSNRNQFIKRRSNKSKESKYNNKESLHRKKSLSTASDNGIDVAQLHVNDTDGDTLNNRTFDGRKGSNFLFTFKDECQPRVLWN